MRPIDGDALSKETGKLWEQMPDGEELSKELMKAINHAPTVDAVQVVRCKDCCWYVEDEECDPFCGHKDIYIRPDYFCADGERVSK